MFEGEKLVNFVRDRSEADSWKDHTTNLRSSISWAIVEEGRKMAQGAFKNLGNAKEGARIGQEYLDSLLQDYAGKLALVVVAGMDYASRVEALENKDVLAGAKLKAESEIKGVLDRAIQSAMTAINKIQIC